MEFVQQRMFEIARFTRRCILNWVKGGLMSSFFCSNPTYCTVVLLPTSHELGGTRIVQQSVLYNFLILAAGTPTWPRYEAPAGYHGHTASTLHFYTHDLEKTRSPHSNIALYLYTKASWIEENEAASSRIVKFW